MTVFRFDQRRKVRNVWMGFHALAEFDGAAAERAFGGFPRDPETDGPAPGRRDDEDDDDWNARDLGLAPRPLIPAEEAWAPRVNVLRSDVDLALEGNGDAAGTAALLIEPLEPLAAVRLQISRILEVTAVHWRTGWPAGAEDARATALLAGRKAANGGDAEGDDPSLPAPPAGDALPFVQETHGRLMGDDLHEQWLTVVLPHAVAAGERFVLEVAYEGPLVERLRTARGYFLKDTIYWAPAHPDNRRRLQRFTFRSPERLQVASGMELLGERVVDGTRIAEWVSDTPVRAMSFSIGRFEVTTAETGSTPPVTVYENRSQTGISPGALRKTIEDLEGSIRLFGEYFGDYPYPALLLTETVAHNGQAFPGFVLLSYQAFGQLHTGVSEVFRAHEVAHQWWGALVHWEDYRDQWISEGFSHYSAALYVLEGLQDEDQFEDILDAWRLDVLGEVNVGQGTGILHYGVRPAVIRESDGHESGPLVAGYRLNSSDTPVDYQILAYEKGAFILHMLRMMLADIAAGDDTRFRAMMRRFVHATTTRRRPARARSRRPSSGRSTRRWTGSSTSGCTAWTCPPTAPTWRCRASPTSSRRGCCTAQSARRTCPPASACRCPCCCALQTARRRCTASWWTPRRSRWPSRCPPSPPTSSSTTSTPCSRTCAERRPGPQSYCPTGQCSTSTSCMGKCRGLPVASAAAAAYAAAAIRQSAWDKVTPVVANRRRHSPACRPSARPSGSTRRPSKSCSAAAASVARSPRMISSTLMAEVHGVSPRASTASTRCTAGLPRR